MRALNVNTLDEVPDSSWFINRIGVRPMSIAEILRGANTFDPAEALEWDTLDDYERQGPGGINPGSAPSAPATLGRSINSKSIPKLTLDWPLAPNSLAR